MPAADRLERFDGSLLGAASRSAEASNSRSNRGAISVLEVLDARRTLRAVRLEALAARNDYARALRGVASRAVDGLVAGGALTPPLLILAVICAACARRRGREREGEQAPAHPWIEEHSVVIFPPG